MLESVIKGRAWNWTVVGKHPAAMDYIRLGDPSPLLDALADWAAKGYDQRLGSDGRPQNIYSWRFWLRGVKKGNLICGLGRDSSDRIGRPFPLLIMGEGTLKGWEKNWTLLPVQLNRTWKSLEYIAAHRFDDAGAMEEGLRGLNQPETMALKDTGMLAGEEDAARSGQASACREQLLSNGFGMIKLNNMVAGEDADQAILKWHGVLKGCCNDIPRAVFIGGTPQHTYISVIQHPLGSADFIRLWSV